jgi:F5/8 type C domain
MTLRSPVVFLIYLGLTIVLTYPLIFNMGSVLPNDAGDPALNTWILWWNSQTVPFSQAWWNAPAFYPAPGVLTFSENLLGLSLISTPLSWMGFGPQAAYNVVFLLTFPLSAIGAYLLIHELTGRRDASFIGGLLFAFAPYRIAHLPQLQSLASFPMPFALLGLHRYLRDPHPKWLAVFAGGWLLQGLCNGYYLLFFTVFVAIWILWFASPWSRLRPFIAISVAWLAAAVPMLPLLLHYRDVHAAFGFTRDFGTIRGYGADVAGLLFASHHLALWGSLDVFRRGEGELFPGLTIVLLVLAGVLFVRDPKPPVVGNWAMARRVLGILALMTGLVSLSAVVMGPWRFEPFGIRVLSVTNPIKPLTVSLALALILGLTSPGFRRTFAARSVLGFYALAAFVTWLLSLGPAPTLMGNEVMYRGPYTLLMFLPGFNALRVPARFWMMTTLCLAVVGGIIFGRLTSRYGRNRAILAVIVTVAIMADTWMAVMPLAETPQVFTALGCAGSASGPIVELPLGHPYPDVAAMYRQMSHHRPVVNGYSGYFPPHYSALRFGLTLRDPDVLTQLAAHDINDIIVNRADDPEGRWDDYVKSHPHARHLCTEGKQSLYRVTLPEAATQSAAAKPVSIALIRPTINTDGVTAMIDQDRLTRWESGPQTERASIDIDLGAMRSVAGIDLMLGPFVEDFPRGLVIEASEDARTWRQLWSGGSGGLAFVGAFESPRDVPLKYRFATTQARFLRLRLTARDDTFYWSIAELRVLGP